MVKIVENPIKMDNLGVPLFLEIPIHRRASYQMMTIYRDHWSDESPLQELTFLFGLWKRDYLTKVDVLQLQGNIFFQACILFGEIC